MNGGSRRSGKHRWGAGARAGRRREAALRRHGGAAPPPRDDGPQRPKGPAGPPREAAEELRPPRGEPTAEREAEKGKKKNPAVPSSHTHRFLHGGGHDGGTEPFTLPTEEELGARENKGRRREAPADDHSARPAASPSPHTPLRRVGCPQNA